MRQLPILMLCCTLLQVHTEAGEHGAVEFLRATIDGPFVAVQPPRDVDWAAFAPELVSSGDSQDATQEYPRGSIDVSILPRTTNEYGQHATATYDVPAQGWEKDYFYYLVSSDGVTEVHPSGLRGQLVATWPWSAAKQDPAPQVGYRGDMLSLPRSLLQTATGGLVIASATPLDISTSGSSVPLLDVLHRERGCDCTVEQHADSALEHVRLVARYEIAFQDRTLLFVAWSPDHTCSSGEPNYYFKLVEARDLARRVASGSAVWRQPD